MEKWFERGLAGALTLALLISVTGVSAQSGAVEIEQRLDFKPGTAKARAALVNVATVRDIISDPFQITTVDLNDDGTKEILVMGASSANCGSGGCLLVVLERQGNKAVALLTQNLPPSLGVTKQKIGAYRALAALDDKGAVAVANKPGTPMHGKPMVYAMAGASTQGVAVPDRAVTKQPAPMTLLERPTQVSGLAGVRASKGGYALPAWADKLDVVGVKIGMPAEQAAGILRAHNPKFQIVTDQTTFTDINLVAAHALRALGGFEGLSTAEGDAEEIALGLALPPHPSLVTEIFRIVRFPNSRRPTVASIAASMQAKYGARFETIDLNQIQRLYVWRLDAKAIDRSLRACYAEPDRRWSALKRGDDIQSAMQVRDFRNLVHQSESCGMLVVAMVELDHKNEQIATGFSIRASNEPYRALSLKSSMDFLRASNEARKGKEASQAAAPKVKF
jgi:hypothetical protein